MTRELHNFEKKKKITQMRLKKIITKEEHVKIHIIRLAKLNGMT